MTIDKNKEQEMCRISHTHTHTPQRGRRKGQKLLNDSSKMDNKCQSVMKHLETWFMEKERDKIINTWKNHKKPSLTWRPPGQAVYKAFEREIC